MKRTLEEIAAAGIEAVEFPIDAAPTIPVSALREAVESLGLTLSARVTGNHWEMSADRASASPAILAAAFSWPMFSKLASTKDGMTLRKNPA